MVKAFDLRFYDLDPLRDFKTESAVGQALVDPDATVVDSGLIASGIVDNRGQYGEDILHAAIP